MRSPGSTPVSGNVWENTSPGVQWKRPTASLYASYRGSSPLEKPTRGSPHARSSVSSWSVFSEPRQMKSRMTSSTLAAASSSGSITESSLVLLLRQRIRSFLRPST